MTIDMSQDDPLQEGPLLIFGGPYSNLQATEAMRREAERREIPPERVICTGDIVAYGAHPNETAALIRDWGVRVIQGNCEEQLAAEAEECGCGFEEGSACAMMSVGWYGYANARLDPALRAWMGGLPRGLRFDFGGFRVAVIHGGAAKTARFLFASAPDRAFAEEMELAGADLILAGHCGLPFLRALSDGRRWLNAGVIGMPANDGTPDGWCATLTPGPQGLAVAIERLAYDAAGAAAALREAGSAPAYAEALETGLWPSLDVLPIAEREAAGSLLFPVMETITPPRG